MELSLGEIGESTALAFLHSKGYRLIYKNYHVRPYGELDLVVLAPDGTLVLAEVKTMTEDPGGLFPEDNASKAKLRKMTRAGEMFVAKHPELVHGDKGWRLDLIAVTFKRGIPEQLTINDNDVLISHYENVG